MSDEMSFNYKLKMYGEINHSYTTKYTTGQHFKKLSINGLRTDDKSGIQIREKCIYKLRSLFLHKIIWMVSSLTSRESFANKIQSVRNINHLGTFLFYSLTGSQDDDATRPKLILFGELLQSCSVLLIISHSLWEN